MSFELHAFVTALAIGALAVSSVGCAGGEDADPAQDEAAFTGMPSSLDYPSESGWAIGMIRSACDLDRAALDGASGSITRTDDGVIYKATKNGAVVASAWASSTFIGARKRCL